MKNYLLFAFVLISFVSPARDNYADYPKHTANDRLLLIFTPGTSAERKAAIIEASHVVTSFTHLPSPALTICFTHDRGAASAYFETVPEVQFVSFFITDGKHYAGVLNKFFIKITDKNFEPLLREKLKQTHLTHYHTDRYIPNLYQVNIPANSKENTIEWCNKFRNEAWCSYASPDYLVNPIVCSNDPYYNRQWSIANTGSVLQGHGTPDADMDVDSAWMLTTGDPTIKVGIIDSGVDTLHEDLMANLLPGYDAVSDSTDGYPTPNYPEDGHGTCCSGIVAAVKDNNKVTTGIAPLCKIIPVRAFYYILLQGSSGPLPYSTATAFADAIGWAWSVSGADILSNSWGLPPALLSFLPGGMQPVNDAIQQAYTNGRNGKGTAMFFSSGNDNDSLGPIWPSSLLQTIAVNATSMCDERKNPADCSGENWGGDYGPGLDFSAPGVKIATTDMNGNKGFTAQNYTFTFNGTSAACPNAAGVGALLLSLRADLTAEDVQNIIAMSAEKVGGYNYDSSFTNGTWSRELGYGRVNAYQALQLSLYYSSISSPLSKREALSIFPNPGTGLFFIRTELTASAWVLFDMRGAEVLRGTFAKGEGIIDASAMLPGIYLLKVNTGSSWLTGKVTITR